MDNRKSFLQFQNNFVTKEAAAEAAEKTRLNIAFIKDVNGFPIFELTQSDGNICGGFAVSKFKTDGCSVLTFFYDYESAEEYAEKLSHLN